ncbi:replication initiation protein [Fibrella forsythiae]|uniref:Replication initiation protein n=1 Tax=Fibrella forsythiae TaxID=2817061 RepID=A0ABS3JTG1_9BACT|nr:replication initiation protein [Fibrella forsythiae]MBO0953310.1 replication initiation protein [Fibrella forsythiae]
MSTSSAVRPATTASAQIKLFELESTALLKLASVVQEPLDLLLAKNKHKLSVIDRRVYWWILGKMAALQTTNKDEPIPIPAENLVFSIPVGDLYLQAAGEAGGEPTQKKKWVRGQLTSKLTYSTFKTIAEQLIERSIIVVDHMDIVDPTKRKVGAIAIFPRVYYENGILEVHVDRLIVPAMCTLSKGYTKYQREAAMALGHDYSQILYVRLCRFLDIHQWRVAVDELRVILEATSYNRYSNFKQKVLLPALREINQRTDITVELTENFAGRKVTDVHFTIYLRADASQQKAKKHRQETEASLIDIYGMDLELRRSKALAILQQEYLFSAPQQQRILANEAQLNRFIELHFKIEEGLLRIKTSPTRYIASVLFPNSKAAPVPGLF